MFTYFCSIESFWEQWIKVSRPLRNLRLLRLKTVAWNVAHCLHFCLFSWQALPQITDVMDHPNGTPLDLPSTMLEVLQVSSSISICTNETLLAMVALSAVEWSTQTFILFTMLFYPLTLQQCVIQPRVLATWDSIFADNCSKSLGNRSLGSNHVILGVVYAATVSGWGRWSLNLWKKLALLLLLSSLFYNWIIMHIDVFYPPGGPRGAVPGSSSSTDDLHIWPGNISLSTMSMVDLGFPRERH